MFKGLLFTIWVAAIGLTGQLLSEDVILYESDGEALASLTSKTNAVAFRPGGEVIWSDTFKTQSFTEGDEISTGANASAKIEFVSGGIIELSAQSQVVISTNKNSTDNSSVITLLRGNIDVKIVKAKKRRAKGQAPIKRAAITVEAGGQSFTLAKVKDRLVIKQSSKTAAPQIQKVKGNIKVQKILVRPKTILKPRTFGSKAPIVIAQSKPSATMRLLAKALPIFSNEDFKTNSPAPNFKQKKGLNKEEKPSESKPAFLTTKNYKTIKLAAAPLAKTAPLLAIASDTGNNNSASGLSAGFLNSDQGNEKAVTKALQKPEVSKLSKAVNSKKKAFVAKPSKDFGFGPQKSTPAKAKRNLKLASLPKKIGLAKRKRPTEKYSYIPFNSRTTGKGYWVVANGKIVSGIKGDDLNSKDYRKALKGLSGDYMFEGNSGAFLWSGKESLTVEKMKSILGKNKRVYMMIDNELIKVNSGFLQQEHKAFQFMIKETKALFNKKVKIID